VAASVTIRSEWLRAFLREHGGRVFVVEGLFVVG
jgi:hypothetical protein